VAYLDFLSLKEVGKPAKKKAEEQETMETAKEKHPTTLHS
jgi:hypothetical protein